MENYINSNAPQEKIGGVIMSNKVLIATLYNPDPVLLASMRLSPDRLVLLIDKKPDKKY